MVRRFGRDFAADERDHPLKVARSERMSRFWPVPWIGDQDEEPACVGFAGAGYLAAGPVANVLLDPTGLYYVAQRFDEWLGFDYEGTSVRGLAKGLQHLGLIGEYAFTQSITTVRNYLLDVGPLVLGIDWYAGMCEPGPDGLIEPTGEYLGGHAILLTGVNRRSKLYQLPNSWSREWGIDGMCYLHEADLAALLADDGEACTALEIKLRVGRF